MLSHISANPTTSTVYRPSPPVDAALPSLHRPQLSKDQRLKISDSFATRAFEEATGEEKNSETYQLFAQKNPLAQLPLTIASFFSN